ncbi:MAG: fibronectin/fibrinogen-binding protein [Clostridiales bacterium]|nr:fibronectin/fibrinogen-binding protein [Clostridiales bacterium]
MPMDGLTIGFAQREAEKKLIGGRVDKITQPQKDTLILHVRSLGENLKLLLCASPNNPRIQLTAQTLTNPAEAPMFCMLMRKHLQGGIIKELNQIQGDRFIHLVILQRDELGELREKFLYVELMGRHSNIIATYHDGKIIDSIRHIGEEMSRVREVLPGLMYQYPPMQDKLDPSHLLQAQVEKKLSEKSGEGSKALAETIGGLSQLTAQEIYFRLTGSPTGMLEEENIQGISRKMIDVWEDLKEKKGAELVFGEDGRVKDIVAFPYKLYQGMETKQFSSLWEAMDAYYATKDTAQQLGQKSGALLKLIKNHIHRCERKLLLQQQIVDESEKMESYRIKGDLINANAYHIQKGDQSVIVDNFYDPEGGQLTIALDEQLTSGQNAQQYFKKYQKAKTAREMAGEQIEKTRQELFFLDSMYEDAQKSVSQADLMEVREELYKAGYVKNAQRRKMGKHQGKSKPYRYESQEGITILVGKNAVQNERITSQAAKEEWWLHAKDIPGSHVVIKKEGELPETTLLQGAQLAAFYSKGKDGSQVPVDYTMKKYIKKPGGAPTGFVTYTQQKTIYVTVTQQEIQKIKLIEA